MERASESVVGFARVPSVSRLRVRESLVPNAERAPVREKRREEETVWSMVVGGEERL